MSATFCDSFDEVNGFYVLYNDKKYTYNNLYNKIIDKEKSLKEKNEEILTFEIKLNGQNFNIIKNTDYNIFLKSNLESFAYIHKKVSLTNSISLKKYIVYNSDHVATFLNLEELDQTNLTINPSLFINDIFSIFDGDSDKYVINPKIQKTEKKINISKVEKYWEINKLEDFILKKINYVKYNENSLYYDTKDRNTLLNILKKRKYTFLCGPSGIGKTVTLLKLRALEDYNVLYFNLKSLTYYYDSIQIKENVLLELSYCFNKDEDLNNFIDIFLKDTQEISQKSNIDIIQFYLKKIIENYKEIKKLNQKRLFIILDQYKSKYDPDKALHNLLRSFENEISYIKCSSMNEENVREELYQYLFEKNDNIVFVQSLVNYKEINSDKNSLNEKNIYLFNLEENPKYIEEFTTYFSKSSDNEIEDYSSIIISNLTKKIKDIITNKSNIYNISPILIVKEILEKEGSEISMIDFKKMFNYLPLKYIVPKKNKDNKYTFYYSFHLLKKVFEVLENELIDDLNYNYYQIFDSGSKAGFVFEEIVQSLFREGKNLFNDEQLPIKKEIKVNSIFNLNMLTFISDIQNKNIIFKDKSNKLIYEVDDLKEKKNIFINEIANNSINSIIQKPCGEFYDLAVLIPTEIEREFDIFLCQITLDKDTNDFLGRSLIIETLKRIKKRFELLFDIKLKNFYFSYILDKKRKGNTKVEKLCSMFNNKLYCAFYDNSILYNKNNTLFNINIMRRNCLITELPSENISYNLNSYQTYNTFIHNSNKIRFKNKLEIKYETDDNEIKDIIENTSLLCQIYKGITIQVLNKKRLMDDEKELKNEDSKKDKKENEKKKLKDEEKKIYKNINNTIGIPKLNDEEKKIFNYKNKKFSLSSIIKKKLVNILKNNNLEFEIIERGAFFPLNISELENYLIIYYNSNNKNIKDKLILAKYFKSIEGFNFWSINEEKLLEITDGFAFVNLLNNPKKFFANYSSYLIKIKNESENEDENEIISL